MTIDLGGTWHNEHGSELHLEVGPGGRITGTFRTGVGFGKDETFEVSGFTNGRQVAFTANFGKHGSLTSWVGHLGDHGGEPELHALWHMAAQVPHTSREADLWKGVWSGSDTFRPGPAAGARRKGPPPMPLWLS